MKKITLILLLFISINLSIDAQVLVNQVWTSSSGSPNQVNFPISEWEEIDWTSSALTNSNDLIIVGNTLQSSENTDILITKQNSQGQILWEQTFAGSAGSYDYGLAVSLDNNQNIFVAGVITNSNQTTDIALLKYSSSGTLLWSSIIDGGTNQFDVATDLTTDSNGNVFIIGATLSPTTQSDWLISKFDNNGTLLWTTSYNYANLHEIPVAIKTNNNGDIVVSGFSNSTISTWDFTNILFSKTDGTLLIEERKEIPDLSISDGVVVKSDSNNNIYIAGSTIGTTNTGQDIQLIKINNSFDIEWIENIDAEGLDDKAKSIAIDNLGNVIIAGNSKKNNNGTQITLAKFTPAGVLIFKKDYLAPTTFKVAEVVNIEISDDNDIFIAGTVDIDENKNFVTLMYDSQGNLRFEKFFSGDENSNNVARNINIPTNGEVLITGRSEGIVTKYTTVKYEILKRSEEVVLVDNNPHHKAKEFIVKFLPSFVDTSFVDTSFVDTSFVDDKTKRYGTIYDILDSTAANSINERIDLRFALFSKVFPRLSTSHTTSTTRLGETIPIPEFWSTFLVVLQEEDEQTLDDLITDFESMSDYVVYAHPNHIYEKYTIPDDDFFESDDQSSLFPSADFQNGHINVEPAWDIETGQNHTKVGVFDDVIFWAHEDFGDGTLEGSQIVGGWSFNGDGTNITGITDPESHGTACAGIIGAIRDNDTGIAGIAGGGLDAQGNDNEGVQLFSLGISDDEFAEDDVIGAAIVEGAMFNETQDPSGYGLNIQSHSWGGGEQSGTIRRAVEFCFRNQCVFVAARGNAGNTDLTFPSCYNDDWVINVGAAGINGEYFNGVNGNAWAIGPDGSDGGSSFGGDVDIIAPGVSELIISLINPNQPFTENWGNGNVAPAPQGANADYQSFFRTSAAAPHVAGVTALMHSLHHTNEGQDNNLAPDDIEFLLQRYADDIVGGNFNYPAGYDINNGWGRINAFEVIQRLEAPRWRVFHSGVPDNSTPTTTQLNNVQVSIPFGFDNIAAGNYIADSRVQITNTYLDIFSPTTQIVDSWGRLSSTTGVSAANPISAIAWANFDFIIQDNVASVTTTTFAWHISHSINGQNVDVWIPAPPEELMTAYSLHLFDPLATSTDEIAKEIIFNIFPNPSKGIFNVEYFDSESVEKKLEVYSSTGILVKEIQLPDTSFSIQLDLTSVSSGVYFCHIISETGIQARKIIKQ